MVESSALLKRRSPKGYRGFESLPHRIIRELLVTDLSLPQSEARCGCDYVAPMTKYIAAILCLGMFGCATTTTAPRASVNAKSKRERPSPNLDRTYDWGSMPPVADPDREKD